MASLLEGPITKGRGETSEEYMFLPSYVSLGILRFGLVTVIARVQSGKQKLLYVSHIVRVGLNAGDYGGGERKSGSHHEPVQPAALRLGVLEELPGSYCEIHRHSVACLLLLLENSGLSFQNSPGASDHGKKAHSGRCLHPPHLPPPPLLSTQRPQQGLAARPS